MANDLDARISALTDRVTGMTNVMASAEATLTTLAGELDTALSQARAAGATTEQLQALDDLSGAIATRTTELAQSISANTRTPPAEDAPAAPAIDAGATAQEPSAAAADPGAAPTEAETA